MASINKLTPGQILYDVKRNTGIQAYNGKYSVWPVKVISVHPEDEYIIASWNHNTPNKMYLHEISKLRLKEPKQ